MDFKAYFQDEINYLNEAGNDFSRLNPKLAKYLSRESSDPDVRKLMEGFAFLTAGLRKDIDDDLSELTQSVLQIIWPNSIRPVPPITMIKFSPLERSITTRHVVERGTKVRAETETGAFCDFTTTSECVVYPLEISAVKTEQSSVRSLLSITFQSLTGVPVNQMKLDDLRLWFVNINQGFENLYLYCLEACKALRLSREEDDKPRTLPPHLVTPGGLGSAEALLPGAKPHLEGYRLLQEYFSFKEKFLCLDMCGLAPFIARIDGKQFTLEFEFDRPLPVDTHVDNKSIQVFCTPAVNLVSLMAVPLGAIQKGTFYSVKPFSSGQDELDIFSIDELSLYDEEGKTSLGTIPRFNSMSRQFEHQKNYQQIYYKERFRHRLSNQGQEVSLVFVQGDGTPVPIEDEPTIHLTCFNASLAPTLAPGSISTWVGAPLSFVEPFNLTQPTKSRHLPDEKGRSWAILSSLSATLSDITDPKVFASILRLFDYQSASDRQAERALDKRLDAFESMITKPVDRLFKGRPVRGLHTVMSVKADSFKSAGELYLFARLLTQFLAFYATQNSFHMLEIKTTDNAWIWRFPPETGRQPLI